MTDRVDCLVFEDQLDALVRGALPEEGMAAMEAHVAECPRCAALERVGGHLVRPSLEELEAEVPDALVASMWNDVERAVGRRHGDGWAWRGRWVVPALSAAALVLLVLNGAALRALDRAADREAVLVEQLLDQQRRLVDEASPVPARGGGPPGALAGRSVSLRSLAAGGEVTVGDLKELLAELPSGTPVMSARRREALAGSRLVPAAWREVLGRLDSSGDVTVDDLLRELEASDVPDGTTVPAGRILELLS